MHTKHHWTPSHLGPPARAANPHATAADAPHESHPREVRRLLLVPSYLRIVRTRHSPSKPCQARLRRLLRQNSTTNQTAGEVCARNTGVKVSGRTGSRQKARSRNTCEIRRCRCTSAENIRNPRKESSKISANMHRKVPGMRQTDRPNRPKQEKDTHGSVQSRADINTKACSRGTSPAFSMFSAVLPNPKQVRR